MEFKGKHSQKLPEELLHVVVNLLLVLTELYDETLQVFLQNIDYVTIIC